MLALATIVASAVVALPQGVPATPTKPAPAQPAQAQTAVKKLGVGDAAPALQFDEWIKGDKVAGIEKGKVHVIEFWATWCGPCIAVMPHLSELQKKHPEVVVVSVAASERGKDEASKIEKVKKFVEDKGDTMSYRVVYAGDREKMSKPWMQAAGQNGIPCAFIVDKESTVAWIGHPMSMDKPLEQIVSGSWDAAAAKKLFEEERAAEEAQMKLGMMMRQAMQSGNYDEVVVALREVLAKSPNENLKFQLFELLAGPANKPDEAWKLGEEILAANKSNAMMMNQLAWTIVDPEGAVKTPNLDLALKAAEAGVAASKEKDGAILDTLARVVFLKGDAPRAIELQKKAIEAAPAGQMKDSMKETLKEYEASLKKA